MNVKGKLVDGNSLELDGIDTTDYPDFADAFVVTAFFMDGTELTEHELELLQDNYPDRIYELVIEQLF